MEEKEQNDSDPSQLTTQQLWREIASLEKLLTQRINSINKAVEVAHDDLVRVPTETQKSVSSLKELIFSKLDGEHLLKEEKFNKVEQRFSLLEQVRIEQKKDTMIVVDHAIQAVKEAVAKSETATFKQIDQQSVLLSTTTKGLEDKINDMKERMAKVDSAIINFEWVRAEVANLKTGSSTLLGKNLGTKDSMGWILLAIAIIGFFISYFLKK